MTLKKIQELIAGSKQEIAISRQGKSYVVQYTLSNKPVLDTASNLKEADDMVRKAIAAKIADKPSVEEVEEVEEELEVLVPQKSKKEQFKAPFGSYYQKKEIRSSIRKIVEKYQGISLSKESLESEFIITRLLPDGDIFYRLGQVGVSVYTMKDGYQISFEAF